MRVKTGFVRRQKHKKVLKLAKGFWMTRHKRVKVAKEAVMHSGMYAYIGRRLRRRNTRTLWITRINAALKEYKISYSVFINKLAKNQVTLNRKILSEIALNDPKTFQSIVSSLK